ncbi:hypothetical protein TsFJ059_007821 [Trichoderma semiorbis]|uniref:Zn(2)-C6 fungal-type domain-containing protein n=1 Tax=Trichoderma semiorbis TaxID=1491008 RepID=A0A9P8KT14_9HYPO|nr:hypothetical protein TsFJ059_007821 [Trichoderma semiorbis]
MSSGVVRSTALRAGGACVRCRKGKTKCVYENGRAPCKNCAKGMHECYLPSESMAHHHGQSPARHTAAHRPSRDALPASGPGASDARQPVVGSGGARHVQTTSEKLTPELIAECERVVSKTFPACVAFHKPTFVQQLKNGTLESSLVYGLLTAAARSSPNLIRRYGGTPTAAADTFAGKTVSLINANLDQPNLADIQALCLVIIHEWGSRNAVRAYVYLGQATRLLQMYRILNSHHASDNADQFLRDESFRRTLWLTYILDCLLTCTPGRYPALALQDTTDVALPCSDINFAFGNTVYVKTLPQQLAQHNAHASPGHVPTGEIGEYGYIVLAATIWRDVVGMLAVSSFREDDCTDLVIKIERLRATLPMQFVDKPGQINLHMTMGSGYTFAMLHCLIHCATIFVHRRRLLEDVTSPSFNIESYRMSPRCHDIVDRLFTSCHGTLSLLAAVESGAEKDHVTCFPIFMLFSAFTAGATIAYLSLKGLTPPNAVETAAHIVKDGLRFMHDGNENWPLMTSWLRHLTVMQRVLHNDAAAMMGGPAGHAPHPHMPSVAIKDEMSSNADTNPDAMEYDQQNSGVAPGQHPSEPRSVSGSARGESSEPPISLPRRPGVTTINGGSNHVSTPDAVSPPPAGAPQANMQVHEVKRQSPEMVQNGMVSVHDGQTTSQDMTAPELCEAFERQLLDLDDLAAFMGGGV